MLTWLRQIEPRLLLGLLILTAGTGIFLEFAEAVTAGSTHALDVRILQALRQEADPTRPIGPVWLQEAGRDLTSLGGTAVLALMVVMLTGYFLLDGKPRLAAFLPVAALGGVVLNLVMKYHFARPRPIEVPHLALVSTPSFPSSHSMMAAVIYLGLGAITAAGTPHRSVKIYAIGVAVALTALIGLTRIYLGVHYPSDVLAGWTAGLLWSLACWLVARWIRVRTISREQAAGSTDTSR